MLNLWCSCPSDSPENCNDIQTCVFWCGCFWLWLSVHLLGCGQSKNFRWQPRGQFQTAALPGGACQLAKLQTSQEQKPAPHQTPTRTHTRTHTPQRDKSEKQRKGRATNNQSINQPINQTNKQTNKNRPTNYKCGKNTPTPRAPHKKHERSAKTCLVPRARFRFRKLASVQRKHGP